MLPLKTLAIFFVAAVLMLGAAAVLPAQQLQYEIESIGTASPNLPDDSNASGINNLGVVAGFSFYTNTAGFTSFRPVTWSDAGLDMLMTFGSAAGTDINIHGVCIGWKTRSRSGTKAFQWDALHNGTDLHFGNLVSSVGSSINSDGALTGSYDYQSGNPMSKRRGFFRDPFGQYTSMPSLGGVESGAAGLNDLMSVAGMAENLHGERRAVLWQVGTAPQDLQVGGVSSRANDVNNLGQVVGHWLDGNGQQFGFLWQAGSSAGLAGLTTHPNSVPRRINEFGFVVGICQDANLGDSVGVLWDRSGQVHRLDALIPANSGWANLVATDINDLGEISGTGFKNGSKRGFRMTPQTLRARISGAQPAVAGAADSRFFGAGFTPNAAIHFFSSTQSGHTSALGFFVEMAHPHWIGQATADAFGRVQLSVDLPLSLQGRSYYSQAVDTVSGRPSLLVQQRFL
jgi:probable HAF family extracellular repeat protein